MPNLSNPSAVRDILERHGFRFSKSLGQNFLINPSVCPRMAELGGAAPGVGVLEIGPGIGVLTAELASRAEKVVSVEIDKRLIPVLEETLAECGNISIVNDDVLRVNLQKLLAEQFAGLRVAVCANLPYYLTSPIIMHLLESRLPVQSITVMVQKEAAARLCALPGTRDVGAVSIAVRYFSEPRVLFPVSRGSFMPAPNVDSAVIRLDIRNTPPVQVSDEAQFFRVVRASFGQRRKTLANALSAGLSLPKPEIGNVLDAAGVPRTARAEQLSLVQFAKIAEGLKGISL